MTLYVKQRSLGMKTLSEIFASRGDPWVTQRERDNEFPVEETENPEIDRYFCRKAKKLQERRPDRPLRSIGHTADTFTRGVNLRIEARKKMRQARLIKVK